MHVRITRVAGLTPKAQREVLEAIQTTPEALGAIERQEGFRGYGVLANRDAGTGALITSWQTLEAMQASEDLETGLRELAVQTGLPKRNPTVRRYEILAQHIDRLVARGSVGFARLTQLGGIDSDAVPESMEATDWRRQYEAQNGFLGFAVLANREEATAGFLSLWRSRDSMWRSEELEDGLRSVSLGVLHPQTGPVVDRYEVLAGRAAERTPAA